MRHYVEQCASFLDVTVAGEVGEQRRPANHACMKVTSGGTLKKVSRLVVAAIG